MKCFRCILCFYFVLLLLASLVLTSFVDKISIWCIDGLHRIDVIHWYMFIFLMMFFSNDRYLLTYLHIVVSVLNYFFGHTYSSLSCRLQIQFKGRLRRREMTVMTSINHQEYKDATNTCLFYWYLKWKLLNTKVTLKLLPS